MPEQLQKEIDDKCQSIMDSISRITELVSSVSDKAKSSLDESASIISNQLVKIEQTLDDLIQSYESTKDQVEEVIDEADAAFTGQFTELKDNIDSLISENSNLFDITIARLESTQNTAQAGIEKIIELNQSLDDEINILRDNFNQQFETADKYIETQCEEMDDAIQELGAFVEDCKLKVAEELENTVQEFEEHVQAPVTKLTENLETFFESLREYISKQIVNECSEKLEHEIMQPIEKEIDEVVESVENYITQFVRNVVSGGEDSKQSKQEMEASTQIIEEAISPVLNALERVRGLAGTVGISI